MPHEGGANEDGLGSAGLESFDVGSGVDAAFGDEHFFSLTFVGQALGQALGGAKIDGEGGEVTVIDANQPGFNGQSTFQFGLVVHLDECC